MNQIDLIKLKFLPFAPSPITQLLYLNDRAMLLVARENSTIEIIETKNSKVIGTIGLNANYVIKKVIAGLKDSLFVVTMNNEVLCYDLFSPLVPFTTFSISTGGVWDADYFMAQQTEQVENKSNDSDMSDDLIGDSLIREYLVFATDEGSLYVYASEMSSATDLNERQHFTLLKVINSFGDSATKALSCRIDAEFKSIFAGYSAGSIKKYGADEGCQQLWNVEIPSKVDIWSLATFNEKILVAGASEGSVFIIDSCFGAILQEFKDSAADINCLLCDNTRQNVYYTGLDSRIFAIGYNEAADEFIKIGKNRGQSHPINSLVFASENTLASGGVNSDICFYDIGANGFTDGEGDKKKHKHQQLQDLVFFAANDTVGFYHNRTIGMLKLDVGGSAVSSRYKYLFELKSDKHLNSIAFTPKYDFLAVSDIEDGKVVVYHTPTGKKVKEINISCYGLLWRGKSLIAFEATRNSLLFYDAAQNFKFDKAVSRPEFERITHSSRFMLTENRSAVVIADHLTRVLLLYNPADDAVKDFSFLMDNCHLFAFKNNTNEIVLLTKSYRVKVFNTKTRAFEQAPDIIIKKSVGNVKGCVVYQDQGKYLFYSDYYTIKVDSEADEKVIYDKAPRFALDIQKLSADRLFEFYINWKEVSRQGMEAPINTKKFKS